MNCAASVKKRIRDILSVLAAALIFFAPLLCAYAAELPEGVSRETAGAGELYSCGCVPVLSVLAVVALLAAYVIFIIKLTSDVYNGR